MKTTNINTCTFPILVNRHFITCPFIDRLYPNFGNNYCRHLQAFQAFHSTPRLDNELDNDSGSFSKQIKTNDEFNIQDFVPKLGSKIKVFYNNKEVLDFDFFINRIFNYLKRKTNYMVLVKVRYKKNLYLTLDSQSRFYYEDFKSKDIFVDLNSFIINKIKWLSIEYDFNWIDLHEIEVSFREILYLSIKPNYSFKEYKDLMINKAYLELSKLQSIFGTSLEEDFIPINHFVKLSKIVQLDLKFLVEPFDFIKNFRSYNSFLKKEKQIDLDRNIENSIFGVKYIGNSIIIIKIEKIYLNHYRKYVFTRDGRLLFYLEDNPLENGSLKRVWKGNTIILNNNQMVFRSKSLDFTPIKLNLPNKEERVNPLPDNKIGSFDREVFIKNSTSIIYALGFHSYLDKKPQMVYINKKIRQRAKRY